MPPDVKTTEGGDLKEIEMLVSTIDHLQTKRQKKVNPGQLYYCGEDVYCGACLKKHNPEIDLDELEPTDLTNGGPCQNSLGLNAPCQSDKLEGES